MAISISVDRSLNIVDVSTVDRALNINESNVVDRDLTIAEESYVLIGDMLLIGFRPTGFIIY